MKKNVDFKKCKLCALLCKLYDRTHDLYNTTCGLTSVSNKFEEYVDEKIQLK